MRREKFPRWARRLGVVAAVCALAACGSASGGGGGEGEGGGSGGLFLPELLAQSIIESVVENFRTSCTNCPSVPQVDGVDTVAGVDIEYDVRLTFQNAGGILLDGNACGTTLVVYLQYENTVDGTADAIDPAGDKTHLESQTQIACGFLQPPGVHPYLLAPSTKETIELSFAGALQALDDRLTFVP